MYAVSEAYFYAEFPFAIISLKNFWQIEYWPSWLQEGSFHFAAGFLAFLPLSFSLSLFLSISLSLSLSIPGGAKESSYALSNA
jgi:hypothetical protein